MTTRLRSGVAASFVVNVVTGVQTATVTIHNTFGDTPTPPSGPPQPAAGVVARPQFTG